MTQPIERLLERGRQNAVRCRALIGVVLLVVAYDLWTGGYVGAVLGIATAAVLLAPSIAYRSRDLALPWELSLVAASALVVRSVVPFQPVEFLGNYLVIAAIALVLAVETHVYTRVEMSHGFATLFVAMVTMTVATAWALGRWALDLAVGTAFIESNDALMWELLAAALVGVAAGVLFDRYFRRFPPEDVCPPEYQEPDDPTPGPEEPSNDPASRAGDPSSADEASSGRNRRPPRLADVLDLTDRQQLGIVRAMQLGLLGVAAFGVSQGDVAIVLTAAGAVAVTFLPVLLRREYDVPAGVGATLWIATAVFLHTIGTAYIYEDSFWWHNLTHAVSGSLIAGIGYATFRAIDEHTSAVRFPSRFMVVLLGLFVVSVGVVWEILEFATDRLMLALGSEPVLAQYGLHDTMTDMLANVAGAVVVAAWGTAYLAGVATGVRQRLDGGT